MKQNLKEFFCNLKEETKMELIQAYSTWMVYPMEEVSEFIKSSPVTMNYFKKSIAENENNNQNDKYFAYSVINHQIETLNDIDEWLKRADPSYFSEIENDEEFYEDFMKYYELLSR